MVVSAANLDPDALPRKLLCARSASSAVKGITRPYHQVLSDLNFPGLSSLLSEPPKCSSWRLLLKSTWASLPTSHSLKNAMLANAPSSLTIQPPTGRLPLGTLHVWITSEFVSWLDVTDWKVMLLVSAVELHTHGQEIPHVSSVTRESLGMLHTSYLHALSSMRRGWNCTQRPRPLYVPKSQTRELTHKTSWR